jgi:hypothetical protein
MRVGPEGFSVRKPANDDYPMKQIARAKNVKPSIRAAEMIMAV